MRLLAVDDDPFMLDLLPASLEHADFCDLTLAASGAEALAIIEAQSESFDCLLLDVEMPTMDGITLCARIRALPGYRDKPILMLTAKTDSISIENAFVAGANDYITKPFNVKSVTTRIHVAQRLLQTAGNIKRLDPKLSTPSAPPGIQSFDITDQMHIANIDRLILSFSFGNYLTQLERYDLASFQVFAVALDDMEAHFNSATSQELTVLLSDIARAIPQTVTCPHLLMSYEGNGMFLCITRDPDLPDWDEIETGIADVLARQGSARSAHPDLEVCISVGTPIAPNANRTQRVKKTFERAFGRVATRHTTKKLAA